MPQVLFLYSKNQDRNETKPPSSSSSSIRKKKKKNIKMMDSNQALMGKLHVLN